MFAANIGAGLYVERRDRKLVLINNTTDTEFITGDQPTINLDAYDGKPPEKITLYYPLSPSLALILTETDGRTPFPSEGFSAAEARYLNAKMAKAAHSQVFGRSERLLMQANKDAQEL